MSYVLLFGQALKNDSRHVIGKKQGKVENLSEMAKKWKKLNKRYFFYEIAGLYKRAHFSSASLPGKLSKQVFPIWGGVVGFCFDCR
ncbi:MAG TPA: hypothetical protein VNZ86_04685, partial [Bacteroidia bacterium]|nr:hypothetical protein [Bacteroidia bacterium]